MLQEGRERKRKEFSFFWGARVTLLLFYVFLKFDSIPSTKTKKEN